MVAAWILVGWILVGAAIVITIAVNVRSIMRKKKLVVCGPCCCQLHSQCVGGWCPCTHTYDMNFKHYKKKAQK